MRRVAVSLVLIGALAAVVACGSGGSIAGGAPLVDMPSGGPDHPKANGWDPFASSTDRASSSTDFPGCSGGSTTVRPSQVLDAIFTPICEMAKRCGGSTSTTTPTPPSETNPKGASSVSCDDILDIDKIGDQVEDKGPAGLCELLEKIVDAMEAHPECNPPIQVPEGVCMSAITKCLNDIAALGCNPSLSVPPTSCQGLSFGKDDTPTPPAGTGGSSNNTGGSSNNTGGSGVSAACMQCIEACGNDSTCQGNCFSNGACP